VGPLYEDPRVADWPLIGDSTGPILISAAYLGGIFLGTFLMKRRAAPFQLKGFSLFHNAFLFALSLYMCIECIAAARENFKWDRKFSLWCNPVDPVPKRRAFSPSGARLARILYIHYVSKAYEFVGK
jgi:hypothetical protein